MGSSCPDTLVPSLCACSHRSPDFSPCGQWWRQKRSHSLGESLQREGKGLESPGWHSCSRVEARDHLRQVGLGNSVPGLFPSILLLGASFYPKASLPVYLLNWDRSEWRPINASTLRLPTTQCLEQIQPFLCML